MTTDLTCQQLVELLTDYLETALPPETSTRFEAHLATCSGCQAYLAQMRATLHLLGTLSATDLPPETVAELLVLFRSWQAAP